MKKAKQLTSNQSKRSFKKETSTDASATTSTLNNKRKSLERRGPSPKLKRNDIHASSTTTESEFETLVHAWWVSKISDQNFLEQLQPLLKRQATQKNITLLITRFSSKKRIDLAEIFLPQLINKNWKAACFALSRIIEQPGNSWQQLAIKAYLQIAENLPADYQQDLKAAEIYFKLGSAAVNLLEQQQCSAIADLLSLAVASYRQASEIYKFNGHSAPAKECQESLHWLQTAYHDTSASLIESMENFINADFLKTYSLTSIEELDISLKKTVNAFPVHWSCDLATNTIIQKACLLLRRLNKWRQNFLHESSASIDSASTPTVQALNALQLKIKAFERLLDDCRMQLTDHEEKEIKTPCQIDLSASKRHFFETCSEMGPPPEAVLPLFSHQAASTLSLANFACLSSEDSVSPSSSPADSPP